MSFKKFCPKCGNETSQLVDKLCLKCFTKNNTLFDIGKVKFFICKWCGKLLFNNTLKGFEEETIAQEIATHVKIIPQLEKTKVFVELSKLSELDYEALIKVQGFLADNLVEDKKIIKFQLKETTCDSCMKLNADYREAILQLRSENMDEAESMLKLAEELLKKEKVKNPLAGTSKISKVRNGFDLWVGSKKATVKVSRYMAKLYDTKIIVSKKLIGEEKNGKRKYRHTFCIKH